MVQIKAQPSHTHICTHMQNRPSYHRRGDAAFSQSMCSLILHLRSLMVVCL